MTYNFHDEYLIGKGGYGNVYKGKNDESFPRGKQVAIKRLNMEFLHDVRETRERQKRSFDQELKILSSFHHPNIVKLYGYVNTYGDDCEQEKSSSSSSSSSSVSSSSVSEN